MLNEEKEDKTIYKVVINHEEQYSIWPVDRENPLGWNDVGKSGPKAECLDYIQEVWTDMRPLSLRKKMEEMAKMPPPAEEPASDEPEEESLVSRLSKGRHPIEARVYPENSVAAFKESIDRKYCHIKFTDTRGGTELGFEPDSDRSNFKDADFDNQKGKVTLAGRLTLDYVKVMCCAEIELPSLKGEGYLIIED